MRGKKRPWGGVEVLFCRVSSERDTNAARNVGASAIHDLWQLARTITPFLPLLESISNEYWNLHVHAKFIQLRYWSVYESKQEREQVKIKLKRKKNLFDNNSKRSTFPCMYHFVQVKWRISMNRRRNKTTYIRFNMIGQEKNNYEKAHTKSDRVSMMFVINSICMPNTIKMTETTSSQLSAPALFRWSWRKI